MSSQVVRVQGFNKGSLGAIGKEVERDKDDLLENRNEDIDKNRTHMNEYYKHSKNGLYGEWKDVCKGLNVVNAENLKKNATAFEGMIVTSNKEFFEEMGYVPGQEPPEQVKEYFEKSYEFAKKEIGFNGTDQNILSAVVHYDETTPHLQLYYVPVVDSWKDKVYEKDENGKVMKNENGSPIQARDDKGKIIYNDVKNSEERRLNRTQFWQNKGGKNSYSQMQDRYYEQVSKEYGLGRGEKGSTKEHTTKAQWEAKNKKEELTSLNQEKEKLENEIKDTKSECERLKKIDTSVNLKAEKNKLMFYDPKEVEAIKDQNKALKIENGDVKGQVKALEKKVEGLQNKLSKAENDLDQVEPQLERLKDLESENKELQGYIKRQPKLKKAFESFETQKNNAYAYGKTMLIAQDNWLKANEERRKSTDHTYKLETGFKECQKNIDDLHSRQGIINSSVTRLKDLQGQLDELQGKWLKGKDKKSLQEQIEHEDGILKNLSDKLMSVYKTVPNKIDDTIKYLEIKKDEYSQAKLNQNNYTKQQEVLAAQAIKDYKYNKTISEIQEPGFREISIRHSQRIKLSYNEEPNFRIDKKDRPWILERTENENPNIIEHVKEYFKYQDQQKLDIEKRELELAKKEYDHDLEW